MTAIARILTVLIGIPATGLALQGSQALAHAASTMPDSHWPWLRLALSIAVAAAGGLYIACQLADKETHR